MKILYPYGRQTITKEDINAVVNVLKSSYLTQGPVVAQFEQALCRYTGAKYAIAVSSGTAGLHIACLAAGVSPGDEGITSPITFIASANCIVYCGGKVRFADIDETTGLIDPDEIEKQITKKTKVIIPVHYAGQSCDMERIHQIAKKNHICVIEDAAHAIGSEYKGTKVGSCKYSDMTVFSFHPVKTMTTGEGGAITTNSRTLYEKLLLLRTHGITKDPTKFINKLNNNNPWYYEMQDLGFNYRMTDIQAALGTSQLKKLPSFIKKRNRIVRWYDGIFSQQAIYKSLLDVGTGYSCRHLYVLLIDFRLLSISRAQIMNTLARFGIFTQVHYIPIFYQPWYKENGYRHIQTPNADKFYEQCISIPLYPGLTKKDIIYISSKITKVLNCYKK